MSGYIALCFVQNTWFKDHVKAQWEYDKLSPSRRHLFVRYHIFVAPPKAEGSIEPHLMELFGKDFCLSYARWEWIAPKILGGVKNKFNAVHSHMNTCIALHNPDFICCFGGLAGVAMQKIADGYGPEYGMKIFYGPHPHTSYKKLTAKARRKMINMREDVVAEVGRLRDNAQESKRLKKECESFPAQRHDDFEIGRR